MKYLPAILLIVLVGGFVAVSYEPVGVAANEQTATMIGTATTSASFSVTSSTRVLATTTNALGNGTSYTRLYATICNPNANPVYLNLDGDKAAGIGSVTTVIAAAAGYSACFEITDRNLYQGSVTASSTNQTATTINVKDYVRQ